jgi:thymidylate synthase (FAD)
LIFFGGGSGLPPFFSELKMRFVESKAIFLASTALDTSGVVEFLESIGAPDWGTDAPSDGEMLAELAGRLCYLSFDPELNPNLTMVRTGNASYLANLIAQEHHSVLEHAGATYALLGISRVFCDELKRHRHLSWSETSLRFVRLSSLAAYWPTAFAEHPEAERAAAIMRHVYETCERAQREFAELFDLDRQDFATKKRLTSAMRRSAPMGLTTNLIATGNLRTWREIIGKRCTEHAEEEIAKVIGAVRDDLRKRFPNAMGDL